jgi:predicted flap endonuclease-1-like 5' DNA nuclease
MGNLIQNLNSVIPFADSSRPIWWDVIYSLVLCTFLYYAPHIPFAQIWETTAAAVTNRTGDRQDQIATLPQELAHTADEQAQADVEAHPHIRPPPPTVEDDDSSDSDDSLNDEDLAALIRDAEALGGLADPFAPGPADPRAHHQEPEQLVPTPGQPRRLRDPNRQVGAKKAKSLARRERLRAYHEFMREQGDMQRAQEASVAQEREKDLAETRARRAKVEAEIEERERKKREEKRALENQRERDEREVIQGALTRVADALKSEGRVELQQVAQAVGKDASWVEILIRKEGMLGLRTGANGKVLTMLTSKGWIIQIDEKAMQQLHAEAASYQGATSGKVSWTEMGTLLDGILRKQPRVH